MKKKRSEWVHGLYSTYVNHRCRCAPCTDANARYNKARRVSRAIAIRVNPRLAPHGKVSTYTNWNCRCDKCKKVYSARRRSYYQRRSA